MLKQSIFSRTKPANGSCPALPRVCLESQSRGHVLPLTVQQRSRLQGSSGRRGHIKPVCSLIKRGDDVHTGAYVCYMRRLQHLPKCIRRNGRMRNLSSLFAVTKLPKPAPRDSFRMGLPSKGRMAEDTIQLLKVCYRIPPAVFASRLDRGCASMICSILRRTPRYPCTNPILGSM